MTFLRTLTLASLVTASLAHAQTPRTIVIGFVGGRVHADNAIHLEVRMANELRSEHPKDAYIKVFANHHGDDALREIHQLLDTDHSGALSPAERASARIILYGHSWGASQTLSLATQLDREHIPVELAVLVDCIAKNKDAHADIPGNVAEVINFYQDHGLLRGRSSISAADPTHTRILGNIRSDYSLHPVDTHEFPWFARTFMRSHIEIENDPAVWNRIRTLIDEHIASH